MSDLPDFKNQQELHEYYLLNPDIDFVWYRNMLLTLSKGNEEKSKKVIQEIPE